GPTAAFDSPNTSISTGGKDAALPYFSGSASNVSSITVALKGGNHATANVVNGRWQVYISQVYPGTYSVEALDNDPGPYINKVLAMGTLTVNPGDNISQTKPVIIYSFTASPSTVTPGQPVTFSWSSTLSTTDTAYWQ